MASLSNAVRSIKAEVNPIPRARSAGNSPRPMRNTGKVYISRKVRIIKSSATNASITASDISKALFPTLTVAGSTFNLRVDGISVWNVTNSSTTANYSSVTPDAIVFNTQSTNDSLLGPYEDYGSNNHGASVSVNFPLSLTNTIQVTPVSTLALFIVSGVPPGITTTSPQTLVSDIYLKLEA